jgi:hypothetical protein
MTLDRYMAQAYIVSLLFNFITSLYKFCAGILSDLGATLELD